jgi:hypothetical protein
MAHNLTDGSTFAAAVSVPDGTDQRTAASLYPALQALADRTRSLFTWLGNLSNTITLTGPLLFTGANVEIGNTLVCNAASFAEPVTMTNILDVAHINPSGNLQINNQVTTNHVSVNSLTCAGDTAGLVTCSGSAGLAVTAGITATQAVHAPKAVVQGRITAGTTTYLSTAVQRIFNTSASATGVIWKIGDTPALGADGSGFVIEVSSSSATNITVEDPSGATLVILNSGTIHRATLACDGTSWLVIDFS